MARSNAGVVLFATLIGVVAVGSGTGLLRIPDSWRVNAPATEEAALAPAESEADRLKQLSDASNPDNGSEPSEAEAQAEGDAVPAIDDGAQTATDDAGGDGASEHQTQTDLAAVVPTFGNLRVLPSGEALVAGTAAPNAIVEAFAGSTKLGSAKALENGDFVITFDNNLAPGDYEIVLRADSPDGTSATSTQTAIVSIPDGENGELLALVEEPGQPSRLISTGEGAATPMQPVEPEQMTAALPSAPAERPADDASDTGAADGDAAGEGEVAAVAPQAAATDTNATDQQARIEAVEIDGSTVFVAGAGTPGARLRVYANEILLGETTVSPGGRFLIEIDRDLPVGDYMVRADTIDQVTGDVLARVAVPFTRPDAERFAAVAPAPSATLPMTAPQIPAPETATEAPGASTGASDGSDVAAATQEPAPQPIPGVETNVLAAPPLIPTDGSVIIRRGDTLWQISRRVYGRGVRYTTIYTANVEQIRDPDRIWPGQIFAVPETTAEDDEAAIERHRALSGN